MRERWVLHDNSDIIKYPEARWPGNALASMENNLLRRRGFTLPSNVCYIILIFPGKGTRRAGHWIDKKARHCIEDD